MTLHSIPLIMSDDAVVLICLIVAWIVFSLSSRFFLFLLSFVMVSPRYLYDVVFLILFSPSSHSTVLHIGKKLFIDL